MQVEITACQCLAPAQDVFQMGLFNNASVLKNVDVLFLKTAKCFARFLPIISLLILQLSLIPVHLDIISV